MKVIRLEGTPSSDLAPRLAEFEAEFTYPLGMNRSFRISHGDDYTRFFASMGRAACFLALDGDRIVGAVACVIRRLRLPGGSEVDAAYLADLKVSRTARSGMTLYRLVQTVQSWAQPLASRAFGVVMEGTRATPDLYTGRAGLPMFQEVSRVAVLRVPTADAEAARTRPDPANRIQASRGFLGDRDAAEMSHRALTADRFVPEGGDPALRSRFPPEWLHREDGGACARLEDTLRAKRLIALDGEEILSAHLSCFAFRSPELGAALIHEACARSRTRGFPAVFVAVAEADSDAILSELDRGDITVAPARVYAFGLSPGAGWIVNTAEI